MATSFKTNRNNELAIIHIAKEQLGMDEETYRAMLWTCARVRSSKELDYAGRVKVLTHLKGLGFKPKPPAAAKTTVKLSGEDQHKMIRGLWLELFDLGAVHNSSEQAILRFVKNQTGVDRMEWLSTKQASNLIEALKKWIARSTKQQVANG